MERCRGWCQPSTRRLVVRNTFIHDIYVAAGAPRRDCLDFSHSLVTKFVGTELRTKECEPDVSLRRAASVPTLVFPSLQSQASSSSASPSSSSWKPWFFFFHHEQSAPATHPTNQLSFTLPPSSHYVWFLTSKPVKHLAQLVEAPAIFFDPEAGRESASFCQLGRTLRWHHLSTFFSS